MKEQKNKPALLAALVEDLDQSVQVLDAGTLSSLRQIRARAVAQVRKGETGGYLFPIGFAVSACLVFAVISFVPGQHPAPERIMEDFDLFSTMEDLNFYEELEFYQWLEDHA